MGLISKSLVQMKENFRESNSDSKWGFIWYLLDPLMLFIALIFIFEVVFGDRGNIYPSYLLVGLVIFNFFRFSTIQAFHILKKNKNKINSDMRPEVFVLSNFFQSILLHLFEILLIVIVLTYYGVSLMGLIFYPILFLFFSLFVLGISLPLSIIGFHKKELFRGWTILTRTLWFVTPTFYFVQKGDLLYNFNLFNPMFYFLKAFRDVVVYNVFPNFWEIFIFVDFSLLVFFFGLLLFIIYSRRIL